jgi:pSer/pThr/pTyr-binding forkhead associated (FHA) protein
MRDGSTRKLAEAKAPDPSFEEFIARTHAVLVVIAGGAEGTEYSIDGPVTIIGRDPGTEVPFNDDAMSREHAAVEFAGGALRIRDLGSRNGTQINGHELKVSDLHNGDRIAIGEHVFQLVLEARKREPKTWVVDES